MENIPARDILFDIICIYSAAGLLIIYMQYLPALTMRHFIVLKARKHTDLAKLDSSLRTYVREQGPQRIAKLILHHSL